MKHMSSRFWFLGLPWLLLSVGTAQSDFCQNNLPANNPDAFYIDHGDGTVTDTRTGLMWKQCAEGLSGATCRTGSPHLFNWANALPHAETSTFANYSDWRLPNVKELSSLVEKCRVSPAINTNRFPNTPGFFFWSGSPHAGFSQWAWGVYFYAGAPFFFDRTGLNRVRLVRDEQ